MAKSRHQMTLFDCVGQSPGPSAPKKGRLDSLETDRGQSADHHRQTNYVTVDNSGPTTVIVNTSSPHAAFPQTLSTAHGSSSEVQSTVYSEPPGDIAQTTAFPPVQPTTVEYPVTYFSKKPRSFNPAWFHTYSWLEYSVQRNACFCYPCRLFGSGASGGGPKCRPEQTFTTTGFKDWKHATGKSGILTCHDNCLAHKLAIVAWNQYTLNSQRGTLILEQLCSARAEQIKQNRHYLKTVAEVLLLCSNQEIALRGHRESDVSKNRGNFRETLELVAKHDPIVHHRLSSGPRNAAYTSPEIQNTLLNVMGNIVQKQICVSVQKAGMYSILADESKDCSKREQMAIVLRYVDTESATIFERFLMWKLHPSMLKACQHTYWTL